MRRQAGAGTLDQHSKLRFEQVLHSAKVHAGDACRWIDWLVKTTVPAPLLPPEELPPSWPGHPPKWVVGAEAGSTGLVACPVPSTGELLSETASENVDLPPTASGDGSVGDVTGDGDCGMHNKQLVQALRWSEKKMAEHSECPLEEGLGNSDLERNTDPHAVAVYGKHIFIDSIKCDKWHSNKDVFPAVADEHPDSGEDLLAGSDDDFWDCDERSLAQEHWPIVSAPELSEFAAKYYSHSEVPGDRKTVKKSQQLPKWEIIHADDAKASGPTVESVVVRNTFIEVVPAKMHEGKMRKSFSDPCLRSKASLAEHAIVNTDAAPNTAAKLPLSPTPAASPALKPTSMPRAKSAKPAAKRGPAPAATGATGPHPPRAVKSGAGLAPSRAVSVKRKPVAAQLPAQKPVVSAPARAAVRASVPTSAQGPAPPMATGPGIATSDVPGQVRRPAASPAEPAAILGTRAVEGPCGLAIAMWAEPREQQSRPVSLSTLGLGEWVREAPWPTETRKPCAPSGVFHLGSFRLGSARAESVAAA